MIDYKEELKYKKQEKDRIKSEINDLKSRIVVESGRRHHRHEVNAYRNRLNRLQMRLNQASLEIAKLEKMIKNPEPAGQIQIVPNSNLDLPSIGNGEITITDRIEFDRGFSDVQGDVIQTVTRTIERTVEYKNGKPVSSKETVIENISTLKPNRGDDIFIKSRILE